MANVLLKRYEDLCENVQDLSKLTDHQLQLLYDECNAAIDYYNGMQLIVKLCCNAIYGATGSKYYRFFNADVAEDITTEGKNAMMLVDKIINNYYQTWQNIPGLEEELNEHFGPGIKLSPTKIDICVYGDTDSRYVNYGEVFRAAHYKPKNAHQVVDFITYMDEHHIQTMIRDGLKDYVEGKGGVNGYFIMELETICGKGIFLAKKKYVMSKFWADGKYLADRGLIKATGVELIQGSSTRFVKDSMSKVIKMLLTPRSSIEKVFAMTHQIVNEAHGVNPKELMKTNGCNKWDEYVISDYPVIKLTGTVPVQLRAAVNYNNFIKKNKLEAIFPHFIKGQKIFWYYCLPGEEYEVFGVPDGVELGDIPNPPKMDYDKQIEKLVVNPLKRYIFSSEVTSENFGGDAMQISFKRQVKI